MIGNLVHAAYRSATKHRLYTLTNVFGLAVALTAALLIGQFVRHELSYDRFWPDVDRTYRVVADITVNGHPTEHATVAQWPFAHALKDGLPDAVDSVARVYRMRQNARIDDTISPLVVSIVDPVYLSYFPGEVLAGADSGALDRPDGIILTASTARRLFGAVDVVGRTLVMGDQSLLVTSAIADRPANAHLDGDVATDALLSFDSPLNASRQYLDAWNVTPGRIYVRLRPGAEASDLVERIPAMLPAYRPASATEAGTIDYDLQAVADIHLHSSRYPEGASRGSINTVIAFTVIAALVLAIAAINFTNLGTALAHNRAKEVGVRKVLGARRGQLVVQFLGEAVATAMLSLLLATAAAELLLPWFSTLMARPLTDGAGIIGPVSMGGGLLVALAVGCAGGLYPALYLTSLRTASVLKGEQTGSGRVGLRSILVLLQFAISIALTVATVVVYAQMTLLNSADLGYQRERIVVLPGLPTQEDGRAVTVLDSMAALPGIDAVARTTDIPTNVPENFVTLRRADGGQDVDIAFFRIGAGLMETLDIQPVAGRLPVRDRAEDELPPLTNPPQPRAATLVVNEAAVKFLGYPSAAAAIGQQLLSGEPEAPVTWTITGVIPDVRLGSAREQVKATVFPSDGANAGLLVLRLSDGGTERTMAAVAATWARLLPDVPFRTIFIADRYDSLYAAESRQAHMLATFAGLAIFVACLGLFGLAAFTAERRTKEIGIRKVLGATVTDIVRLLVWQFSKPVLLANVIAWPIAWIAMRSWLDGFVLRIDLHPGFFLAAGMAALAIAWITVAGHATRVARRKPVLALRYE